MSETSTREQETLVRRLYQEFIDRGNPEVLDGILALDVVLHPTAPFPGIVTSRDAIKEGFMGFLSAFSDRHTEVEDLISVGDRTVSRHTHHMTHTREAMGIPVTGKQVSVPGVDIFRFAEGKIAEWWVFDDSLGMLQQLGVVPPLGQQ